MEGSISSIWQSQPNIHFRKLAEANDIDVCLATFEQLITSKNLEEHNII